MASSRSSVRMTSQVREPFTSRPTSVPVLTTDPSRSNALLLPVASSPSLGPIARNLQLLFHLPNRPPSNLTHHVPSQLHHSPSRHLRLTRLPHAPLLPLRRQISTLRPPISRLQEPPRNPQYLRRDRPRSPKLGHQAMGFQPANRTLAP